MNYPYSSLYLEGQWLGLKLAKLFHPGTDARGVTSHAISGNGHTIKAEMMKKIPG
jgi:hypothetical protein